MDSSIPIPPSPFPLPDTIERFESACLHHAGLLIDSSNDLTQLVETSIKLVDWFEASLFPSQVKGAKPSFDVFQRFFFSDAIPKFVSALVKRDFMETEKQPAIANSFFQRVLQLVTKCSDLLPLDIPIVRGLLAALLSPSTRFYKHYGLCKPSAKYNINDETDSNVKDIDNDGVATSINKVSLPEELELWREVLSVGENCEFVDNGCIFLAHVVQISPYNTEMEIKFAEAKRGKLWISKSDPRIHPFATGSAHKMLESQSNVTITRSGCKSDSDLGTDIVEKIEQWRKDLRVESPVDLKDSRGIWFQAQVVQVADTHITTDANKNHSKNSSKEMLKRDLKFHYVGWPDNLDEWLPSLSPRLAMFNTKSKGNRGTAEKEKLEAFDNMLCRISDANEVDLHGSEENGTYTRSRDFLVYSRFFIENVNFFGRCRGFDVLLHRCKPVASSHATTRSLSVRHEDIRLTANLLANMHVFLAWPYLIDIAQRLTLQLSFYVLHLEMNELRKFSLSKFEQFESNLRRLWSRSTDRQKVGSCIEPFMLSVTNFFLNTQMLNRRLDGMRLLNRIKSLVIARHFGDTNKAQALWLTGEAFLKWMNEKELVQIIFRKGNLHVQVLKQTPQIVAFLSRRGALPSNIVDIMWDLTNSNDSAMQKAAHELLAAVSSQLDIKSYKQLLHRLVAVPISHITQETINLLHAFSHWKPRETGEPLGTDRSPPEPGSNVVIMTALEHLWALAQEETMLDARLASLAEERLSQVLKSVKNDHPYRFVQRDHFWQICVNEIKERGTCIPQALYIISCLVNSALKKRPDGLRPACFSDDLIRMAYQEFVVFKKKCIGSDSSLPSTHSRHSQLSQVSCRLEFMAEAARSSQCSFQLTRENVETICSLLIIQCQNKEENDICYKWIQTCIESDKQKEGVSIFEDSVSSFLLKTHFRLDSILSELSLAGLRCFWATFCAVNQKLGKLKIYETSNISVIDSNLEGLTTLHKIALYCQTVQCAKQSSQFLMSLFSVSELRNNTIDTCLELLETCYSKSDHVSTSHDELACRLTSLLWSAVKSHKSNDLEDWNVKPSAIISQNKSTASCLTFTVNNIIVGSPKKGAAGLTVSISIDDTVDQLFQKVQECVVTNAFVPNLRIFCGGREIKQDASGNKKVYQLGFTDKAALLVVGNSSSSRHAPTQVEVSTQSPSMESENNSNNPILDFDFLKSFNYLTANYGNEAQRFDIQNGVSFSGDCKKKLTECNDSILISEPKYNLLLRAMSMTHDETVKSFIWRTLLHLQPAPFLADTLCRIQDDEASMELYHTILPGLSAGKETRTAYSLSIISALLQNAKQDNLTDCTRDLDPESTSFPVNIHTIKHLIGILEAAQNECQDRDVSFISTGVYFTKRTVSLAAYMLRCICQQFGQQGKTCHIFEIAKSFQSTILSLSLQLLDATCLDKNDVSLVDQMMMLWSHIMITRINSIDGSTNDGTTSSLDNVLHKSNDFKALFDLLILDCSTETYSVHSDTIRALALKAIVSVYLPSGITAKNTTVICKKLFHFLISKLEYVHKLPMAARRSGPFFALIVKLVEYFFLECRVNESERSSLFSEFEEYLEKIILSIGEEVLHMFPCLSVTQFPTESFAENHGKKNQYIHGIFSLFGISLYASRSFSKYSRKNVFAKHSDSDRIKIASIMLGPCLFEIGPMKGLSFDAPLCRNATTRSSCIRAVLEFVFERKEESSLMETLLNRFLNSLVAAKPELIESWKFVPQDLAISPTKRVGLRNLGCTCYQNALMQQLHHMPSFSNAILSVRNNKLDAIVDACGASKSEALNSMKMNEAASTCTDNLLYQLQRMMAALTFSAEKAFYPDQWCNSFKDENGNPTKPGIQHDAQEYFTTLCGRLETEIKACCPEIAEEIFNGMIKGQFAQQILSLHGKRIRPDQHQYFYTVSLDVPKSGGSLESSLAAMCEGEKLSDFRDDSGNLVTVVKRDCFSNLNRVCIFHLKRFELNYSTFQRSKLNSRFSFPFEINLFPYTLSGLSGDPETRVDLGQTKLDYNYILQGIVVHSGTANFGHYYSYIKVEGTWMSFNDADVRVFDLLDNFEEECFGGTTAKVEYNTSLKQNIEIEHEITKSAYMLIYVRASTIKQSTKSISSVAIPTRTPSKSGAVTIEAVKQQNKTFKYRQLVMNQCFVEAVTAMLNHVATKVESAGNASKSGELKILSDTFIELVLQNVILVAPRIPEKGSAMAAFASLSYLATILAKVPSSCNLEKVWIKLTESMCKLFKPYARDVLLNCPDMDMRSACGDALCSVILGSERLCEDTSLTLNGFSLLQMLTSMDMFDAMTKAWRNISSPMNLLHKLAKKSIRITKQMLNLGLVGKLIDLIMGAKLSPVADILEKNGWWPKERLPRKPMNARVGIKSPVWDDAIQLLSILIGSVDFLESSACMEGTFEKSDQINVTALDEASRVCIAHPEFFKYILQINKPNMSPLADVNVICDMISHISWGRQDLLESFCQLAESMLDRSNLSRVSEPFTLYIHLAGMQDSFHEDRYLRLVCGRYNNLDDEQHQQTAGLFPILEKYHKVHCKFVLKALKLALPLLNSKFGMAFSKQRKTFWKKYTKQTPVWIIAFLQSEVQKLETAAAATIAFALASVIASGNCVSPEKPVITHQNSNVAANPVKSDRDNEDDDLAAALAMSLSAPRESTGHAIHAPETSQKTEVNSETANIESLDEVKSLLSTYQDILSI